MQSQEPSAVQALHTKPPAGPKGHWLFQNLPDFVRSPAKFLAQQQREFGGISSFIMLYGRFYLVSDPDLVRQVLVSEAKNYPKTQKINRIMQRGLGLGILNSEGAFHSSQRKQLQPAFKRQRIESYDDLIIASGQNMLAQWKDGDERDILAEMHHVTMAIVTESLFGVKLNADSSTVGASIANLQELVIKTMTFPLPVPFWVPTPTNRALREERKRLQKVIDGIVSDRKQQQQDTGDLLSSLLEPEDGTAPMEEKQLRDELITMFAAGHETTANALAWTFVLLAENPEIQERLYKEIEEQLGGKAPTAKCIEKLPLAAAVFKETLRIKPTAWALSSRQAIHETTLGGYRIPKDAVVLIAPYAMHRNLDYFDNPETFDPDRWLDGRTDNLPKLAYMPFGAGARVCIGNQFAIQEGLILLAMVIQAFEVRKCTEAPIEEKPLITLCPDGKVMMKLSQRNS